MKTYIITLKHDNGQTNFTVVAYFLNEAIDMLLKAENAPESAICKIIIK